VLKFSYKCNNV